MAYTPEQKEEILNKIFLSMTEDGLSARKAIVKTGISSQTFWAWLDETDEEGNLTDWAKEKSKHYTRAREGLSEYRFDSISDDYNETPRLDDYGKIDTGWVALQNLKIKSKQWELSKLNAKKYGDKIDFTSGGDKISSAPTAISIEVVMPTED